jgi:hypothetical protein
MKNYSIWQNKPSNSRNTAYKINFIYGNELIATGISQSLSEFSNHFAQFSIEFTYLGDLNLSTISNKTILIYLGTDITNYFNNFQKFDSSITECKILSNKIDPDFFNLLPSTDFIGFQRHLVSQNILFKLEESSFGSKSLGLIKKNISVLEPILRSAFGLHLEIDVLKRSETNSKSCLPTGLTSEELSQIFRFLGSSYNLRIVSLNIQEDDIANENIRQIISTCIWYLFEGLAFRAFENDMTSIHFQDFVVNIKDIEDEIVFSLNTEDGKWWVKLNSEDSSLYPCSQDDYDLASKGFLSDSVMKRLFY